MKFTFLLISLCLFYFLFFGWEGLFVLVVSLLTYYFELHKCHLLDLLPQLENQAHVESHQYRLHILFFFFAIFYRVFLLLKYMNHFHHFHHNIVFFFFLVLCMMVFYMGFLKHFEHIVDIFVVQFLTDHFCDKVYIIIYCFLIFFIFNIQIFYRIFYLVL